MRDVRLRPWPNQEGNIVDWVTRVGPVMRRIFLSGVEGLPQPEQRHFAERWAEYCGCRRALFLPHGTDALRLALAAVFDHDGLDYGGEVIVPNLSFVASATAPLDRRFGVAFVDVDADTLNIDPGQVEDAIVPGRTRAILPVHQFGQPADMTALRSVAERHGLKIIEDAAQAHGAVWETGPVGSLGDAGAFSFQSSKNLSCGEGGMLTTNDLEVFERAHSLHNAGRRPEAGERWEHASLGWNCRATEYQAALLNTRLDTFDRLQETRRGNFRALTELMSDVTCVRPLLVHNAVRRHGMYMFVMRYGAHHCGGLGVDHFVEAVRSEGVPLHRCYASTLSNQPVMRNLLARRPEYIRVRPTPVADQAVNEIVYIASSVLLGTLEDMEDICAALHKVQRHFAR